MNIEMFFTVLGALLAYRVISPVIDFLNPLTRLSGSKKINGASFEGHSASFGKTRDGMTAQTK
jgi:hypothetical protein